ncbi:MAG TPA: isocitrate/isopropylmalate family dehydrogenase [Mycobacterium sp.]|nr:isocitrate/isopropylmalate family dehydrogenase [Mycobacterium sp.]
MRIAVIPGDGVGGEVIEAVLPMLEALDSTFDLGVQRSIFDWGADKWLNEGVGLPDGALTMLREKFDYILFGALGDPRIPDMEHGREILLGIRRGLSLYVNYRPIFLGDHRIDIYRENTQGLYVGVGGVVASDGTTQVAIDECVYTRDAVTRFLDYCLADLSKRGIEKVTLVHKANAVPNTGKLWQSVFRERLGEFSTLTGSEEYVDAFCYKLIRNPRAYEGVVAPNLFGDIISDVGAALTVGGLGTAPSANICPETGFGLFEPVHGSAPDIAGTGQANPAGAALSLMLMLAHAGKDAAAAALGACVRTASKSSAATTDLGGTGTTKTFADAVLTLLAERCHVLNPSPKKAS